jgi:hypothetical protein
MIYLINILQNIGQHYDQAWLSPSQKNAYQYIQKILLCQDTINLNGSPGSGKTFIASVLSQNIDVKFYRRSFNNERLESETSSVAIVDPQASDRNATRQTLQTLHQFGHEKAILISTDPVADQIPQYTLTLSSQDYEYIYRQWQTVNIHVIDDLTEDLRHPNLHITLRNFALRQTSSIQL